MDEIQICDIHGHLIHQMSANSAQYEVWSPERSQVRPGT